MNTSHTLDELKDRLSLLTSNTTPSWIKVGSPIKMKDLKKQLSTSLGSSATLSCHQKMSPYSATQKHPLSNLS